MIVFHEQSNTNNNKKKYHDFAQQKGKQLGLQLLYDHSLLGVNSRPLDDQLFPNWGNWRKIYIRVNIQRQIK